MQNSNASIKQLPIFSIVTPSYNMLRFLPACCNSVSDQNVEYEHIVVDAASMDGTAEWLKNRPEIISISEKDGGMYDAINKGVRISTGEIISYLNCDEQYLPGVLQRVAEIFRQDSRIDILFGNAIIIRPDGKLLAFRKSFVPRWPYVWAADLYIHSSSMFVRRKIFESGITFDENWKAIGDMDFVIKVLRRGFFARHVSEYFSAFIMTGSNLGQGKEALAELRTFRKAAPFWLRYSTLLFQLMIKIEKILKGAYWENLPLSYAVFTTDSLDSRVKFSDQVVSPFFPHTA